MHERVIVLGNPVLDYALEVERLPVQAGQHQEVRELAVGPGGAANTLIAGARLGLAMQALGAVGDDDAGWQLVDTLRAEGVDVDLVSIERGRRTTMVFVLSVPDGGQSFLGLHGAGAITRMSPGWAEAIRRAAALYFDGWTYGTLGPAVTLEAAHATADASVPLFFDPGPQWRQFSPEWLSEVLRCTSVLSLTEEEARSIVPGEATLEFVARALRARGPQMVVVKRGAQGCLLQRDGETVEHPGFTVPVRDTTGAGDAVVAALILARLRGYDLPATAALANAAGAATVQRLGGGLNLPGVAEINALLQREGITLPPGSARSLAGGVQ